MGENPFRWIYDFVMDEGTINEATKRVYCIDEHYFE